jgi:outer membrane lipoprotein carrier protein
VNNVRIATFFILCSFPLVLWSEAKNEALAQLTEKVDKHYNALQSMRANFVQDYRGAGMTKSESGIMWLKKPSKMRWDYDQPRKKVFLSDGKTAWFYVPGERQARKEPVSKLDDLRSPLRFLLGKTKLMKEFSSLDFADDIKPQAPGNLVLRGFPKGMEHRLSGVVLEVTPNGQINRILLNEVDGSITDFHLTNEVENVPISDKSFHFSPPPGVEVVSGTEVSN